MLTMMEKGQVPGYGSPVKSARRAFAADALREFAAASKPGDVAEVSGWDPLDPAPAADAQKMAAALRDEAFAMGLRGDVSVMRRGQRVFVKREERARARR